MENKTAVIIPTYNEKGNIEKLIISITKILPTIHIIVVDDNSPDGTYKIVEELSSKNKYIHLIKRPKKLGLGTAHIAGFVYAEKEINAKYIITMDCDFSHDPNTIPTIIENLKYNDVVIGSRYIDGGVVVDSPKVRRFISKQQISLQQLF